MRGKRERKMERCRVRKRVEWRGRKTEQKVVREKLYIKNREKKERNKEKIGKNKNERESGRARG